MNLKEQIRHSIPAVIVVVIGAWVMIYYSIVQWETMKPVPSWDLAIFSELAKAYAHFQAPIVPVKGDGYNLLGDHFHPILLLLGPIWRLFPTPLSLLITQDLLLAVSAWPLTRLASRLTNQWVAGALGLVYVLSWGMQGAVEAQFHEIAFAMPMLAYASVAFVERRWVAVTAWSAPLVLVKEDMGLTVLMIGVAVILTSLVPAWYRTCTVIRPGVHGADDPDDAAEAAEAAEADAARNRRRGLRLGVGMIVGGIATFLFSILVFLPAFNINGVWDYGLSSQDKPTSPDALTQKVKVVVMLILTSGIIGVTSPWLLVVLPTLAWRFLGSVEFYWVWDNWHYNATLMPIALGALLDVVARRRMHGSYAADRPVREVGVDGRAVMDSSVEAAEGEGAGADESDVDSPRRHPAAFPTWLTVPLRHRFVVATSILIVVATGVLTSPYLPLWKATDQKFDPLSAEAKETDEAKRPETHRVAVAREVIATIPEGATVVTDLSLLAYLVPRAEVSWVGTSGPDKEYIVMSRNSSSQWGTTNAATWGEQHSKQGADYSLIFNKDGYQIAKRNG
ncbi:DUF2079 domain-containing protein [Actinomyces sp. oral taxon 171]|uniref:DUF2079 domain-containing protein n=1 Tax=Actinomyces sp. oral taxon 171 TaxID=706438 RepID=UPI0001F62097|nr:DUF2079 domain-containing protein [Actinomyces sp. oral taxon 171]EFW26451.1 hypothetical protein HMPREF9057_02165 [Actinomyces sp. oral taxon 171 str. F0337]QCT34228.1 DUF2079 domain-containing protein [Actinomyces sp. oral taxon 171 str. F0337]